MQYFLSYIKECQAGIYFFLGECNCIEWFLAHGSGMVNVP